MTNHTSVQLWNDLTETQSESINGGFKIKKSGIKQINVTVNLGETFKGDVSTVQGNNIGSGNGVSA